MRLLSGFFLVKCKFNFFVSKYILTDRIARKSEEIRIKVSYIVLKYVSIFFSEATLECCNTNIRIYIMNEETVKFYKCESYLSVPVFLSFYDDIQTKITTTY